MKLYTRKGDDGSTGLFGGRRVSKDSLRVEAYGTVDELNCVVALAESVCTHAAMKAVLRRIECELFDLGADLASPRPEAGQPDPSANMRITAGHATELEMLIDQASEKTSPMKSFILPGGTELSARLHLARTVCRRAERLCVTLQNVEPIGPDIVVYLNRLSDLLFAMARQANLLAGVEDVPWVGRKRFENK